MIGHEEDAKILRSFLGHVCGQERIVLGSREADIGKSPLASEVKVYAAAQGFLVLEAQCFQTDRVFP